MIQPKNVLVTTTSSIEGMKVIKHLTPISAHIVLGTNAFSDFLGGMTDIFGGKSSSYQKRLNSIYDDAIKKIKYNCFELGGNCVLGLKIDIDEISGKGKSMFMITAIGTAVLAEIDKKETKSVKRIDEKISIDEINELRKKKSIIKKAELGSIHLDNETWNFITSNQIEEILPYLLNLISKSEKDYNYGIINDEFMERLKTFIENLPNENSRKTIYNAIKNENQSNVKGKYRNLIKDLYLIDYDKTIDLIVSDDLENKKQGLGIATFDKTYYDLGDIKFLENLKESIKSSFPERGKKSTKKQLLSSKDKDVWICECGKTNNIENEYCSNCGSNIYGFKESELKPQKVINHLEEKIELIKELQ